ncbi:hypothetical protein [Mucilaginibacter sp. OK098]|uniref:hypothetical protein n=1 Tax=Mucilaginibacter sp. OK098 TaxID=1855297 RepID=UPI000911882E|nr:hypothetical protein [Mucilaginibacter sp. OK098]SHM54763.1 hypothetical protein SAMN05216524_102478 [Mucilaginibacter sp. OK098]
MKKYLFMLPVMLLVSLSMYGQSTKFSDLIYFTGLSNGEVYNNLLQGTTFRQDYSVNVNGRELEYFKNITGKPNTEKIMVGDYTKLYDGSVLRTVNYTSTDPQHILNMISQAKRFGLEMKFHGADEANNIYLFDSSFYHVSIYLRRDQTSGLVEIKQKEYLGLE